MSDNKINTGLADKDLQLWHQWKAAEDGSKREAKIKTKLINNLSRLIHTKVRQQKGSVPDSALLGEGVHWAGRAIDTFDPNHGVKLSTHTYNWLMKVSRTNTKYQNNMRMSEKKQGQYKHWIQAETHLQDELERDPTDKEMAKRLGWKVKQVEDYRKNLSQDLFESGSDVTDEQSGFGWDEVKLNYIKDNLTSEENQFLKDRNAGVSTAETSKRLGINTNAYNYQKTKLTKKIQGLLQQIGDVVDE